MRELWATIIGAMDRWHQGKLFIEHSISIENDALHVLVGMLVWVVLGPVLRRPLGSWRPLLWLFAIILWNEAVDLWVEQWPNPGHQYGEGFKDLMLTIALPTLLTVLIRRQPALFTRARRRRM